MKLSQLQLILQQASACCSDDAEVVLSFESDTLEGAFDLTTLEGIRDIRIMDDWPLPGTSLMVPYEPKDKLVVFFYGAREHAID